MADKETKIDWQTEDYVKGVVAHIQKMRGLGEEAVRATGVVVVNTGKTLAPRKTGYMANNITMEEGYEADGSFVVSILCRAKYWRFVEFGHRIVAWGRETGKFQPAHPFMRPAFVVGLQYLKALRDKLTSN